MRNATIPNLPGSFAGHVMHEFDFSRPMSQVRKSRKSPYYRTIAHTTSQTRVGFYCGRSAHSGALFVDKAGSSFNLRLAYANDLLADAGASHYLQRIDGYYTSNDSAGSDTMQPIVARLTHSRGFLCGWTMGQGMCAVLDTSSVYSDAVDAARAAHRMAEHDAEEEREYQEQDRERAERELEDACSLESGDNDE